MHLQSTLALCVIPAILAKTLTIEVIDDKPAHSVAVSEPAERDHVYIACYTDAGDPGRTLAAKEFEGDSMSVELCRSGCQNYNYFGVEYGSQCYCGFGINPEASTVPETQCNMVCDGNSDEFCGAAWRIGIYHILNKTEPQVTLRDHVRLQYEI